MQCYPAFSRLNENIEQIMTNVRQLQQYEQTNQRTTQQKEENESQSVQLVQRLGQHIRDCQLEVSQASAILPQISMFPQVIRMVANLEKLQILVQHLAQYEAYSHQTTQEKQQYEASTMKLARQAEQLVQSCQQEIGNFIPTRPMHSSSCNSQLVYESNHPGVYTIYGGRQLGWGYPPGRQPPGWEYSDAYGKQRVGPGYDPNAYGRQKLSDAYYGRQQPWSAAVPYPVPPQSSVGHQPTQWSPMV
ncbi:hypothetical protein [Pasteuria penetrans]|uniref:hypothetical protein n=1 Tax=Pasteuria penetrans TaxID=86005 RepID=UPI000F96D0A8|nr:hypothetical protein [Pasteuria penetrans]